MPTRKSTNPALIGYAERPFFGRETYYCDSLLAAHQSTEYARRKGRPITRWESRNQAGRRILHGKQSVGQLPPLPFGTQPCQSCTGHGCADCRYGGFTAKSEPKPVARQLELSV